MGPPAPGWLFASSAQRSVARRSAPRRHDGVIPCGRCVAIVAQADFGTRSRCGSGCRRRFMLPSRLSRSASPSKSEYDLLSECPICLDTLNDPVILACPGEHMVCREHLPRLGRCPKCRGAVGIPSEPPRTIRRMLGIARANAAAANHADTHAEELEVFVNFINGSKITLYLRPSDTVHDVKVKISELEGIDAASQRVVYSGKCLDDSKTLASYGVGNGSNLHVVMRLRGGLLCDV